MAGWNEWIPGTNMTLTEVLDALRSARVGLDVKDKLYWSFYKIVELAIKEGNANFDVAKAAGAFKDLAARLDASDSKLSSATAQLVQKVDKGNVSVSDINKNLGKLDQTFMSEEFLQQIAGDAAVNAVPADGSLTTEKFADGAVTRDKITDRFFGHIGILDSKTDLNLLKKDGMFVITTALNKPKSGTMFLENSVYFSEAGSVRWALQKAMDFYNPDEVYVRRVDFGNATETTAWTKTTGIDSVQDKTIERAKLSDGFLNDGVFLDSETDLDNVLRDGTYIVTGALNKPAEITGTAFLRVETFKSESKTIRWCIQTIFSFTDINKRYIRQIDKLNVNWGRKWHPFAPVTEYASKFKGKTWMFFGDSITYGNGSSDRVNKSYPALIGSKYGVNIVNNGVSGASWQKDGRYDDICVLTQIENADLTNVDYVTIFAGTNDFGRGDLPIGTVTDTVETTMQGAINNAISNIITANPNVKIALITPIWRQRQAPGDDKDSDIYPIQDKYLKDYVNAIIESAKYNHIPVFNFYDACLINKHNYTHYLADGLHPNDTGYELVSEQIHSFLSSVY